MKYTFLENEYDYFLKESKQDQEVLKDFLGDDYYTKYTNIKNKISDNEYKDIFKIVKKDVDDVKEYIDSFKSNKEIIRNAKNGAKKIYEDLDWIVYRITTYDAAKYYGKNTKWCISGNYPEEERDGDFYFNNYIKTQKLDGGYYFYINKDDPSLKYCVLKKENGVIDSVWDSSDTDLLDEPFPEEYLDELPYVEEIGELIDETT